MKINNTKYYIYIIECKNNIFYTGVTTDYKRRFAEHSGEKKGAKFTKSHKPIKILALWTTVGRSNAQKLESRIKKLTKENKINLINDNSNFDIFFSYYLIKKDFKRIKRF